MTEPKYNENVITYKNDENIKKVTNQKTKKIDLKKSFKNGGVSAVVSALIAHQGIIKTIVPISTYLTGQNAVTLAKQSGILLEQGKIISSWLLETIARGAITSTAILQFCALNPALAATLIGILIGAGATLITAGINLIKSKKGTIDAQPKAHTK